MKEQVSDICKNTPYIKFQSTLDFQSYEKKKKKVMH